jgi:hypothetical protein
MIHRFKTSIALLALMATLAACDRSDQPDAAANRPFPDSASGEVAQYALMKNTIGWLSDSNIVALASQVNSDAQEIPRLQTQIWSRESLRMLAAEFLRDHARMQFAIDSLASAKRIPSQMPAVAPEMKAQYDSLLATQIGLPMEERESQFISVMNKLHARTTTDFAALAANATDPDLRALLANRGVLMEQTHVQRAGLLAAAIARADSARQDTLEARRRGGRR